MSHLTKGQRPALYKGVLPPFQTLLDEHGPLVYRYLAARVGPHDAQDCFQETFISALKAYPQLRSTERLKSWILKIAERKAIDHVRRTKRRSEHAIETSASQFQADLDVWLVVETLAPKQQAAVALRFLAKMKYKEIGELLDCSEAAARQNVRAGLIGLRQRLKGEET